MAARMVLTLGENNLFTFVQLKRLPLSLWFEPLTFVEEVLEKGNLVLCRDVHELAFCEQGHGEIHSIKLLQAQLHG